MHTADCKEESCEQAISDVHYEMVNSIKSCSNILIKQILPSESRKIENCVTRFLDMTQGHPSNPQHLYLRNHISQNQELLSSS